MNHLQFRLSSAQLADEVFVVTARGEIDVFHASEVDRELEALQMSGARHIVVDLLDVPSLESTVMSVLLMHSRRLRTNGGELTLVSDQHAVESPIGTPLFGGLQAAPTLAAALSQGTTAKPSS